MKRNRTETNVVLVLCLVIITTAVMGLGSARAKQPVTRPSQKVNAEIPLIAFGYIGREPVREFAWPIGKSAFLGGLIGSSWLVETGSTGTRITASAGHNTSYSVSRVFSSGRLAQFSQ